MNWSSRYVRPSGISSRWNDTASRVSPNAAPVVSPSTRAPAGSHVLAAVRVHRVRHQAVHRCGPLPSRRFVSTASMTVPSSRRCSGPAATDGVGSLGSCESRRSTSRRAARRRSGRGGSRHLRGCSLRVTRAVARTPRPRSRRSRASSSLRSSCRSRSPQHRCDQHPAARPPAAG